MKHGLLIFINSNYLNIRINFTIYYCCNCFVINMAFILLNFLLLQYIDCHVNFAADSEADLGQGLLRDRSQSCDAPSL